MKFADSTFDFIFSPMYKFNGRVFKYSGGDGWPWTKRGYPMKRASKAFYVTLDLFKTLPDSEKEKYRVK